MAESSAAAGWDAALKGALFPPAKRREHERQLRRDFLLPRKSNPSSMAPSLRTTTPTRPETSDTRSGRILGHPQADETRDESRAMRSQKRNELSCAQGRLGNLKGCSGHEVDGDVWGSCGEVRASEAQAKIRIGANLQQKWRGGEYGGGGCRDCGVPTFHF